MEWIAPHDARIHHIAFDRGKREGIRLDVLSMLKYVPEIAFVDYYPPSWPKYVEERLDTLVALPFVGDHAK